MNPNGKNELRPKPRWEYARRNAEEIKTAAAVLIKALLAIETGGESDLNLFLAFRETAEISARLHRINAAIIPDERE